MKQKLRYYQTEIMVYLACATLVVFAYLVIGKLMPLIMQCRVIIG